MALRQLRPVSQPLRMVLRSLILASISAISAPSLDVAKMPRA